MIDLLPTEEQQQITDSVRSLLRDSEFARSPVNERDYTRQRESALWTDLAELGCFGLATSESDGGSGLTLVEEVLMLRECGRFLVSPAALGTVLAAWMVRSADRNLLGDLLAGKRRVAVLSPLRGSLVDRESSGYFNLIDAETGDLAIAWSERGAALFDLSAGCQRKQLRSLDPTIKLSRIQLDQLKPLVFVAADSDPVWQRAMIYLSAMLTGIIEECRDLAVNYALSREQFGHPIGTFQAVKHPCADMALWAEAAWSQTVWSALRASTDGKDIAFQATNAAMIAAEAALSCARKTLQIHGGMGFTAEISVHLFLKRAHVLGQLAGEPHELQQRLTELTIEN
jgi:alkylation response protein AidB-like acyl-CoA dehydrogenase